MSRHRNVRSMNYSEEYDGYDDVYGHSVEDDYSISPSDAAFMYDRNRQPQMSAFLAQEDDIAEEDESELVEQRRDSKTRPVLNDTDEARLRSCLEEIRNVIGDTVSESVVIDTIITHDFDLRKSLDAVLAEATRTRSDGEERHLRERSKEISSHADDNLKTIDSCPVSSSHTDCNVASLRHDIAQLVIEPDVYDQSTLLLGLKTSFHTPPFSTTKTQTVEKTDSLSDGRTRKLQFKTIFDSQTSSSDEDESSFASLSSLAAQHHKSALHKGSGEFSSLADLANHHLQSKPSAAYAVDEVSSLTDLMHRHLNTEEESETNAAGSLGGLASQNLGKTLRGPSKRFVIPPLGFKSKMSSSAKVRIGSSDKDDVGYVDLSMAMKPGNRDSHSNENKGSDTDSDEQIIDLSVALKPAASRRQHLGMDVEPNSDDCVMDLDACVVERPPVTANKSLLEFYRETYACRIVDGTFPVPLLKPVSDTGRTLCHKWPIHHGKSFVPPAREAGPLIPFKFDTQSPDDFILNALQKKWPGSIR